MIESILGWVYPAFRSDCAQRFSTISGLYLDTLKKFLTLQLGDAKTSLLQTYDAYAASPVCNYFTNAPVFVALVIIEKEVLNLIYELSPEVARILYLPVTLLFELTVGVEELANLGVYLGDVYAIVQSGNVPDEKKGELAGYVLRDIIVDIVIEVYFHARKEQKEEARSGLLSLLRKISF